MKIKLLFALQCIYPMLAMSQSQIKGIVVDDNQENLPYSNVIRYSLPDSTLSVGVVSDEHGRFTLSLDDQSEGYLEASAIGYAKVQLPIVAGQVYFKFELPPVAENLEEVVVVAQKPVFEKLADRLTINVESNIASLGGTALELLEKSPGVSVDRINNQISINGKVGILVMIDDKIRRLPADALLNLLNGINLNEVEKVELITNPSSKYEAAGSGGIVHLITKSKRFEGVSGNIGGSLIYFQKPGGSLNGSLNWNKKKLNGFVSYSSQLDQRQVSWTQTTLVPLASYDFFSDSRIDRIEKTYLHNLTIGLNYYITPKTTIETLLTGYRSNFNQTGSNFGRFQGDPISEKSFETALFEDNIRNMGTLYGGITHRFNSDHQISGSIEYIGSKQNQPSTYANNFQSSATEMLEAEKSTPLTIWIGQVGYDWQIHPKIELSIGTKYNISRFENDVNILTKIADQIDRDENLSVFSQLEEGIVALYLSSQWQLNDNWKIRAGLRTEQTDTELDENGMRAVDRNYTNVFPNIVSDFTLDERSNLSFSYGKRIARPTFTDLAPFVFYSNPVTLFYGNPALLPGISDHIDINYALGEYWATLSYAKTVDQITPFQPRFDQEQEIVVFNSENLKRSQVYSLQLGFPLKPFKSLSVNNTVMLNSSRLETKNTGDILQIVGLNYQGNMTIRLPRRFSIGINGILHYNQNWGIMKFTPYGKLDLGIRKTFGSNNSTLGITFSDILGSYFWDFDILDGYTEELVAGGKYTFGMQGFRISFSTSFGNNEVKKKEIDTGSESEKSRIN